MEYQADNIAGFAHLKILEIYQKIIRRKTAHTFIYQKYANSLTSMFTELCLCWLFN